MGLPFHFLLLMVISSPSQMPFLIIKRFLGSWYPNCLEETKFYVEYLKRHLNTDLEIVGLDFEDAPQKKKR